MILNIANKESENLNEYLGISTNRAVELSAEMSKEIYHFLSKVHFGMKVNTDFSNLQHDLLRRIILHCSNFEETVFVSIIFDKLVKAALAIDLELLKEERINFLSKNN